MRFSNQYFLDNASVLVEAIGFRDVKETKNIITDDVQALVEKFYKTKTSKLPYYSTIRSSIIKISSKNRCDNYENFRKPISVLFNYNEISHKDFNFDITVMRDYICLAQVINDHWECSSRIIKRVLTKENSPSKQPMIEYNIYGPGTFAVIFKPRPVIVILAFFY